jgi:hypothetical protein
MDLCQRSLILVLFLQLKHGNFDFNTYQWEIESNTNKNPVQARVIPPGSASDQYAIVCG